MKPVHKLSLAIVLGLGLLIGLFIRDSNDAIIADLPLRQSGEPVIKIIAFGDSLTAGYGLPVEESYPAQLESALQAAGYDVTVINSGVSGETTKGNLERAAFIRSQNPDIVLLGIGGNDALRLLPVTEARKNIAQTIQILKRGKNPPVVLLLKMQAPLNVGLGYKQEFDALYDALGEEQGIVVVPFLTTEIFLSKENKISDGIHLNQVGYRKVVEQYLLPTLTQILKEIN